MGTLVDGRWEEQWYDTKSHGGRFKRSTSKFRNWVTPDGSPGPTGSGGFAAERDRYHLYVSWACPWAHRTLVFRKLKGLEGLISLSVVHYLMGKDGWTFEEAPGTIPDFVNHKEFLREIYLLADPRCNGRPTVPVLWDKKKGTIVSNESSEIIRMFNSAFDGLGARPGDYYPVELRPEIDAVNERVYESVNNGVYKCGFATTQQAYAESFEPLFETLDWLEERLSKQRYLVGDRLTEADVRLWTTLMRFDAVYYGHFKTNRRRIIDYPRLWAFTRNIYQLPGVAETVNLFHIKHHYYQSHETINPSKIVPIGPDLDFSTPP